jgi:hypothetical protein
MPSTDQLEVILFGPGYGECLLVGLGAGAWMIVDSCLDEHGEQPALAWLRAHGHDPAIDVRLVVATHWHDDHVRGISRVVAECATAKFVCSSALNSSQFITLVDAVARGGDNRAGLAEFAAVHNLLDERHWQPPVWAHADRRVFSRSEAPHAEVWLLSPADEATQRSLHAFHELLEDQRKPVRNRVRAVQPNDATVVVLVIVEGAAALLGGDLETRGVRTLGWGAIVESAGRPRQRASLYKVAHHGSANADADEIWDHLLIAAPTAILAPFTRGSVTLPHDADVARICGRACALFMTAPPARPSPRRRAPAVERTVREVARSCFGSVPAVGPLGRF